MHPIIKVNLNLMLMNPKCLEQSLKCNARIWYSQLRTGERSHPVARTGSLSAGIP